jgi:hypothetical protein
MGMVFLNLFLFFCFLLPAPKECTNPLSSCASFFLAPLLKRSRIPRKKKKKASLSFLSPWTASALNGGVKGSTAWRGFGFKNGMYEYYSYIRRRESVFRRCFRDGTLFAFSFCSFEEEG